jgi:hypothetical protein
MTFSKTHSSSVLAFPLSAEYGAAIEKPTPKHDGIVIVACIIAVLCLAAMGFSGWLPGGGV